MRNVMTCLPFPVRTDEMYGAIFGRCAISDIASNVSSAVFEWCAVQMTFSRGKIRHSANTSAPTT